ncbi:hypothetical protein M1771_09470 [Spiroplasma citri]|uniref:Transmembrane protein n=1 Tax=Spiroplasma citri TaxID=2133 RepID=A0AAX3SYE3_SPICI|nr:hypothetical protein [Spiroplasma citri]WFG96295.1 hypothetical protein M0C40_09520 [Spiroplasma citri]WFH00184.1 hypothetical protein M1771_09470 [Spiroplasma citri]
MINLNTHAIIDLPLPVLITLVVAFAVLSIISGVWYWRQWIKTRRNSKNDNFTVKQKLTIRAAFQKNKYLILFLLCFFCLIGSVLVLIKQVVGFPLF